MTGMDCFGYRTKDEWVDRGSFGMVKVKTDFCSALTVLMCRRCRDARKACPFFKTTDEYKQGLKKYGGLKRE